MRYETGCGWEEVAVDLWFPVSVTVTGNAPGLPYDAFDLRATLELARDELRYRCTSLSIGVVNARLSAPGIDAATLRALSLPKIMDGVSRLLGKRADELLDTDDVVARLQIRARDEGAKLDDRLVTVSRIYACEVLRGRNPAQAVREELGAPSSTVGYWVRRAKDLGYIRQVRPYPTMGVGEAGELLDRNAEEMRSRAQDRSRAEDESPAS